MNRGEVGWRDHLVGLLLCVAYTAVLLQTAPDLTMARDETFYVTAADRYAAWLVAAAEDWDAASEQSFVDQYWNTNHEHPSLAKLAFAISKLADDKWELFDTPSNAYRFPGMLSGGLLLWLIYVFGARVYRREAGLIGAFAFALMPRVFYHSQLDCFDMPTTLTTALVVYCYYRSLSKPWWAIWTGVAFGLALETKHNSWIVPGILLIHWLWLFAHELFARRAGKPKATSVVPWWLFSMATLGPVIFVALWPWLWTDTWERFGAYVDFHTQHVHYQMMFAGENYHEPPFPLSFPWVMTAITVSVTTWLLACTGLVARARTFLPVAAANRWWPNGKLAADRHFSDVLILGACLAPIVVITLPSTPIFGATKHWLPAYPFLAIFAGVGFSLVRERIGAAVATWREVPIGVVSAVCAMLALAPAVVETVHSHRFGLSHYGVAAGGAPGAADLGMNRIFWGTSTGELGDWLAERMPEGGAIFTSDSTPLAITMMHRDGTFPDNIRPVRDYIRADYVLVHQEHHFAEEDIQAWVSYGSPAPVYVLTYDGVPIINVYENPRRRAGR